MKIIIAGSRGINDHLLLIQAIKESGFEITKVISGHCLNSPDMLGEIWASNNNIEIQKFPADWRNLGKSAGYVRNKEMAKHADGLIALWDGFSKGTKHMIDIAKRNKLKVFVKKV